MPYPRSVSSRNSCASSPASAATRSSNAVAGGNSPRSSRHASGLRQEIDLTDDLEAASLLPSDSVSVLPGDSDSAVGESQPASDSGAAPALADLSKASSASLRSWVWTYFTTLPGKKHVQCGFTNAAGQVCDKLLKRDQTSSTKLMRDHLIGVHKAHDPLKDSLQQATLDGMLIRGERPKEKILNAKTIKTMMVYLISECDLAISLTERKSFREFMELMYPSSVGLLQKRGAITDHLRKVYHFHKDYVTQKVLTLTKALAITLDTWTAPNRVAFLGVTAHFIDNSFSLQRCTLGLCKVLGEHTGANLGQHLIDCLQDFNTFGRLTAITADNASNNATLAKWLGQQLGSDFNPRMDMNGCMAHTINLAAQAGLKLLGVGEEPLVVQDSDSEDEPRNRMDLRNLVSQPDGATVNAQSLITRVHSLATHVRGSPQRVQEFQSLVRLYPPEELAVEGVAHADMLLVNQRTRWNWTHKMLERAFVLREAYNRYCLRKEEAKFAISEIKWEKIQQMLDFLEPLHQATDILCLEKYPTMNMVLPMYISLIEKLNEAKSQYDSTQLAPAGDAMILKLEKYLIKTMARPGPVCATVLDPRIKLSYFTAHEPTLLKYGFSIADVRATFEGYASQVEERIKIEKAQLSEAQGTPNNSRGRARAPLSACGSGTPAQTPPARGGKAPHKPFFAPVFVGAKNPDASAQNEVNRYFAEGLEDEKMRILDYWKARATSFPILSRMARQFLAIPATSAPSESVFSGGRKIVLYQRFVLSPDHVEMLLSVKNWYRTYGSLYLGREE